MEKLFNSGCNMVNKPTMTANQYALKYTFLMQEAFITHVILIKSARQYAVSVTHCSSAHQNLKNHVCSYWLYI